LVEALEVAETKSAASSKTVRNPRSSASSAHPAPVAPPPITQTSNVVFLILAIVSERLFIGFPFFVASVAKPRYRDKAKAAQEK
jgi:hypothetical protein